MKIVIGVNPGESSDDAMALGSVLCRAFGAEPALAHIHPSAYDYASPGHVDAEWESYLVEDSHALLARAQRDAAERYGMVDLPTLVYGHRSSGVGLYELAEAHDADMIVIGSAPGASSGRFQIGSTADQLLHGSHVPVALAPAYYRGICPEELGRLVVAFQNTEESRSTVLAAAELAERAKLPLTLLTILLRHRIYGSNIRHGEDMVMGQLKSETEAEQARLLAQLPETLRADAMVSSGDDAMSAVRRYDWNGDELFVLASARGGILRRVFLGDMTYKLLRATQVPAIVMPRLT